MTQYEEQRRNAPGTKCSDGTTPEPMLGELSFPGDIECGRGDWVSMEAVFGYCKECRRDAEAKRQRA